MILSPSRSTDLFGGAGTGDRSREFRLRSQNNLKDGAGGPDHPAMLRQMAEKYPSMDLDRVGIWGHSAGGERTPVCIIISCIVWQH